MTLKAFFEFLNSPAGKKLDRVAKKFLLRRVLYNMVLPGAAAIIGLDEISEVVEILKHLNDNNNKLT